MIPESRENATLKNYITTPVEIWSDVKNKMVPVTFPGHFDIRNSYFLFGPPKKGKTHLLWSQYRAMTEEGIFKTYIEREFSLLRKMQEQSYEGVKHFNLDQKGLHFFIDEFADSEISDDKGMHMFALLDRLHESRAGLTVTSNWSLKEINEKKMFGDRTEKITWRIKDLCHIVRFGGTER